MVASAHFCPDLRSRIISSYRSTEVNYTECVPAGGLQSRVVVTMRTAVQNQLALIFDMDGVIIDSTSTHTLAWQEYLKTQGVETPHIEDRMLGKRNDEIVRDFLSGRQLTDAEVFEHGAAKEKIYREIIAP